ncbi:MAG: glycosyltransferase family 2 protein [Ktedonobacterales bacterium]
MWLLIALLRSMLLIAELALLAPLLYLAVLSVAALATQRRVASSRDRSATSDTASADATEQLPRFALLIPAHNEASVINAALASIMSVDYPSDRFMPIVIADNCTDETAALARSTGAEVYERSDDDKRAKGFALRWIIERLLAENAPYDAYIVVDADSRLSPNFLRCMAESLAAGAQVAQGQYRVHNGEDGWTAGLRAVAFALFNHLRPLGRSYLGWSAGLKGNGMCFRREVFAELGWESYSLAEDAEYHARLIDAGIHVAYVPDAIVSTEMPTTLRQAQSQQTRWERGRIDLVRSCFGPLLHGFMRDRDLARLDVAMEIILPPRSLVAGLTLIYVVFATLLAWWPAVIVASVLSLALGLHIVIGAALARLSRRAYFSLLRAPLFIAWKCWIYLAALGGAILRRGTKSWVRTERAVSSSSSAN